MPTHDDAVPSNAPIDAKPSIPASAVEDSSKYIRTMAKDMAALSGAAQTHAQTQAKAPAPVTPTQEIVEGVGLPTHEESFFDRAAHSPKEKPQEVMDLPSMQEAGSIVSHAPVPPPSLPQLSQRPMGTAPVPAPDRESILERLRQRMHEHAKEEAPAPLQAARPQVPMQASAPKPTQAPEPPVSKEVPVPHTPRTLAPSPDLRLPGAPELDALESPEIPLGLPKPVPPSTPAPRPVPPTPRVEPPKPAYVPPPIPKVSSEWTRVPDTAAATIAVPAPRVTAPSAPIRKEAYREPIEEAPRPLAPQAVSDPMHTYTTDFADRIDAKGASTFSVLAAEQDARGTTATTVQAVPRPQFLKSLVPVLVGILLLTLAGGGLYAAYYFVMNMRDTPIAPLVIPSIVFADEYRELMGAGLQLLQALATTAGSAHTPNTVTVTYIKETVSDIDGNSMTRPAGGGPFVRALGLPAPDTLIRNIAEESAVGIISVGEEPSVFFALRVDSYTRTYASMLTWEPLILRDLALLYPLYPAEANTLPLEPVMASSTEASTSSPAVAMPQTQARAVNRFTDAIVANRDVRVLRDTNGKSLVMYGYADKQTLIIARDEAAFGAILARLKSE